MIASAVGHERILAAATDDGLGRLPNIGPFTLLRLQSIGVRSAGELRRDGAVVTYRRLRDAWPEDTGLGTLYALYGALIGVAWQDLPEGIRHGLAAEVEAGY